MKVREINYTAPLGTARIVGKVGHEDWAEDSMFVEFDRHSTRGDELAVQRALRFYGWQLIDPDDCEVEITEDGTRIVWCEKFGEELHDSEVQQAERLRSYSA